MTSSLTPEQTVAPATESELRFVTRLSSGPAVSHILRVERSSSRQEVDLVVGVRDHQTVDFLRVLDALLRHEFGAVLPGWRDRTTESGAVETVYLVNGARLLRVRLRVVASGFVDQFGQRLPCTPLYRAEDAAVPAPGTNPVAELLAEHRLLDPGVTDFLAELAVRLHVTAELLGDGRHLGAHGELSLALAALKNLLVAGTGVKVPNTAWLGLDEEFAATAVGRGRLACLRDLVTAPAPANTAQLSTVIATALDLARVAAPGELAEYAAPLDSYRQYLGAS